MRPRQKNSPSYRKLLISWRLTSSTVRIKTVVEEKGEETTKNVKHLSRRSCSIKNNNFSIDEPYYSYYYT